MKCVYCTYGESLCASDKNYTVKELLQYLATETNVRHIDYAAGEIGISPYRDYILNLIEEKKWGAIIYTNASIYTEQMKDLLQKGRVTINVSLDAGTSETYLKIKRVDLFVKVIENLTQYSMVNAKIQLKYIFMQGINDNLLDINNFISIAKQLNASIIISRDSRSLASRMEQHEYTMLLHFVTMAELNNIHYTIVTAYMELDADRLEPLHLKDKIKERLIMIIDEKTREIHELRDSTSWKITYPLRKVVGIFKFILRHFK